MIAHVAGVPVEELLLLVSATGAGTGLLLARAWLASRAPFRPRAKRPAPGPGTSGPGRAERCSQAERRLDASVSNGATAAAAGPGVKTPENDETRRWAGLP
jgi:hypothetical protein